MKLVSISTLMALCLLLSEVVFAQARREPLYLDTILIGGRDVRATEFGFGLIPPLRMGKAMLLNSISGQQWELNGVQNLAYNQLRFSQYKYTPMLAVPLSTPGKSLTFGYPLTFSALEHTPRLQNDAHLSSVFFAYSSRMETDDANWSFGFIILDKTKQRHIFPTASYSYASDDRKWRFAFGFPFLAITYFLNEHVEFGTYLGRDTSLNYIPDNHILAQEGRYLDQEQTTVGIAARFYLQHNLRLNMIVGSMISGRYRFMDSDYNETSRIKNYENLSYLRLGLAWAMPHRKSSATSPSESKVATCPPDKDCRIRSDATQHINAEVNIRPL